jgi:hypothetical protein
MLGSALEDSMLSSALDGVDSSTHGFALMWRNLQLGNLTAKAALVIQKEMERAVPTTAAAASSQHLSRAA